MGKSRAQLYAKLQAFKDELSICESISDLLDTKGFKLAVKEYKEYVKAHPGIIATMSIEKSKWER